MPPRDPDYPESTKPASPYALPPIPESEPVGPRPIGVPPGYYADRTTELAEQQARTPNVRIPGQPTRIPPRYFEGDDWSPASFPPERLIQLQRAMIDAGLIDPDSPIHIGVWDEISRDGYRKLLAFANAAGLDRVAALNRWKETQDQFGTTGPAIPPLQVKLSNPDDLKRVFRAAVIDQLGQAWDEGKLDSMVASYQDKERQFQTEAYNLQVGNEGQGLPGTVVSAPDASTFVESEIESEDPTGAQAFRGLKFAQNDFFEMLRGVV